MALPIQIAQFLKINGRAGCDCDASKIGNLYNKYGYARGEHCHEKPSKSVGDFSMKCPAL
jgi:hypothetical protein